MRKYVVGAIAGCILGLFGGVELVNYASTTKRGDMLPIDGVALVSFQENDLITVTKVGRPIGDERTWYDFRPFGSLDLFSSKLGIENESELVRKGDPVFEDQADYYRTQIFPKIPK